MQPVIDLKNIGKQYVRYHPDRVRTFKDMLIKGLKFLAPVEKFWALKDISMEISAGKILGIIGANGSGKSTLLRIIGGVQQAEEGSRRVRGRIGALIELGAGFHPDLTGKENVYINGTISGLTRNEISKNFNKIVSFAELDEFIDYPLRTYSSGMYMRLAFAIAVHTGADILLVDEILAVGDISFQEKCFSRIAELQKQGCSIILVSHDPAQVRKFCDEALWLKNGRIAAYGDPKSITARYVSEMHDETSRRTPTEVKHPADTPKHGLRLHENRFGSLEMEINAVRLLNSEDLPVRQIESGDPLQVEIEYQMHKNLNSPIFGVSISDKERHDYFETTTELAGYSLADIKKNGKVVLSIGRLDLNAGRYFIDVGIYEKKWAYAYDYHWHVYPLNVHSIAKQKGILNPPNQWRYEE
ncbi:MAG: ABC transporter ATP-binding protein [Calditrichia bacterium]